MTMYTKILAQGTKFGSGTTGLDNPAVHCTSVQCTVEHKRRKRTHEPEPVQ